MRKFAKLLPVMMCMIVVLALRVSITAEATNITSGTLGTNGGISWTYDADTKTLTLTGEDSGLNGKWDSSKGKFKSLFEAICTDVEVIKGQNCTLKGSTKAMFANLGALKSVEISNVNTSGVTDMVEMFSGCSKLSSLDLSGFDLTNVKGKNYVFLECTNLVRIETPKTIPETLSIDLPTTYVDLDGEQTTQITKNFSNTTLINGGYLVSKIKLNSSSLTIDIGQTAQLTATISPQKALDKSLTWKSSDTDVATVDANGKVTAVTMGTATITATAADVGGVSATCEVTVTQPVTGITMDKTSLSLKTGGSVTLTTTVSPSNASNKGLTCHTLAQHILLTFRICWVKMKP